MIHAERQRGDYNKTKLHFHFRIVFNIKKHYYHKINIWGRYIQFVKEISNDTGWEYKFKVKDLRVFQMGYRTHIYNKLSQ